MTRGPPKVKRLNSADQEHVLFPPSPVCVMIVQGSHTMPCTSFCQLFRLLLRLTTEETARGEEKCTSDKPSQDQHQSGWLGQVRDQLVEKALRRSSVEGAMVKSKRQG